MKRESLCTYGLIIIVLLSCLACNERAPKLNSNQIAFHNQTGVAIVEIAEHFFNEWEWRWRKRNPLSIELRNNSFYTYDFGSPINIGTNIGYFLITDMNGLVYEKEEVIIPQNRIITITLDDKLPTVSVTNNTGHDIKSVGRVFQEGDINFLNGQTIIIQPFGAAIWFYGDIYSFFYQYDDFNVREINLTMDDLVIW